MKTALVKIKLGKIPTRLLIIVAILLGFFIGRNQTIPAVAGDTISSRQLKSELAKNPDITFINVHTPYEGEIANTDAFIAYNTVIENSSLLPQEKDAPIILYCKTGHMSKEALETVKKLGYTNVRHLAGGMDAWKKSGNDLLDLSGLEAAVLPEKGIRLPVSWGTLGKQLVSLGVIDLAKFKKAVPLTAQQEQILTVGSDDKITINKSNSQFVVDVLWALGLAQQSIVYTQGPMGKEYKADAGNFASTGGWNLAVGNALNYLNRYSLLPLTQKQQEQVGQIAQNVYRPCCGNPTWFPDCNHGMAALAIIELLVSQGVEEADIYRYLLGFNSFWFPDSYLTVATYFARQGTSWDTVDAKEVLGAAYSSSQGAAEIAGKVGPLPYASSFGGSCGT